MLQIEKVGRRYYIRGNTYPLRNQLRGAGANWCPEQKSWWTGKSDVAEQLVNGVNGDQTATEAQPNKGDDKTPRDGEGSVVAGRATYKGRSYYVAGRTVRGHTHWDDGVAPVTTRDGAKVLLYFRDGSRQFWAPLQQFGHRVTLDEIAAAPEGVVSITKTYDRPQTIRSLRKYAERAKQAGDGPLDDGYYYGPGDEVLASGCGTCSQLGRMCDSCKHDYY